ncbi:MAG: hypothetical protein AAF614_17305 [Chloroflexota bacterium]
MSFLAALNSFFLANEVAVVTVVAVALVLFQLALLSSAFLAETAVSDDEAETTEDDNNDLWAAYAYAPWGF